jgi:CelD/BcsL family acetyltransferase involved in cellulose biosynthesis
LLKKEGDEKNTADASITSQSINKPEVTQPTYTVEAVRTREHLRGTIPEWKRFLATRPHGASFFNDPEYIDRILQKAEDAIPNILIVRKDGCIQCVGPLTVFTRRLKLSLSVYTLASFPVRMLRVFGDNFVYAPETDIGECLSLIFGALRNQSLPFDLMFIEAVNTSTPFWEYCKSARLSDLGFRYITPLVKMERIHLLLLTGTYEQYLASLNRETRRNFRRQHRSLFQDLSGAKFLKITQPEEVEMFLDQLDKVFRQTWQARTFGYKQRNSGEQCARLEWMAKQGWLRSYLLVCDHSPLAYHLGYQYGNTYYAQEAGFASPYGKYGPGKVLDYLLLEDLFKVSKPEVMDLGIGDLPYKRSLGNRSYAACPIYILRSSWYLLLLRVQRLINLGYEGIHGALVAMHLDRLVRRLVKHKS